MISENHKCLRQTTEMRDFFSQFLLKDIYLFVQFSYILVSMTNKFIFY